MMSEKRDVTEGWAGRRAVLAWCVALALAACADRGERAAKADDPPPPAPTSALGSYLAARHAQQQHDYARAAEFMGRTLAEDPGNIDLVRRTFVLRVSEGRVGEAVPLAENIVAADRNAALAQIVLVLKDAKAGDFGAAVERARSLPSDGAQRLSGPLLTAWCEMGRRQPDAALKALDAMSDLHGLQSIKELHKAMLADYADRVDEAEAAYKRFAAEQAHLNWRAVEITGNFYERHQRSEEARRLYEQLAATETGGAVTDSALDRIARGEVPERIIASPRDGVAEALFDLASILNQRETLDASLVYVRLALDLRPDFPLAQMLTAEIEEEQQHTAEALAIYRAVKPDSALSWTARLRAATMLDALDRTDEAAAALRRMAEERPRDFEPLVELGDILRGRSRFAEAVGAYDQAIARVKQVEQGHWRLFYSRAVALERSGQWPRAEADLRRALELEPEEPLTLNYLGYSWIDKGENLEPALKMIKRAVELRPNDGYIVDSLGWAYYRLGNYADATQILEHAIELLPEDPTINDHLGDAYWRSGRLAEARFQWRRALQFKPDADEIKSIETKLDRGLAKLPSAAMRGG
jgi:Flp pilus assembly protein TadD